MVSTVPTHKFKFPTKFEKGEKIGEGTYGWVYHACSKENGCRFALKQFKGGRVRSIKRTSCTQL